MVNMIKWVDIISVAIAIKKLYIIKILTLIIIFQPLNFPVFVWDRRQLNVTKVH